MPSKKDIDAIHRQITGLVRDTNRKVIGETTIAEKNIWRLDIQHGSYRVNIFHPLDLCSIDVVLVLRFDLADAQRTVLEGIYSDMKERFKFDHGLRSCLVSPYTSYDIKYAKIEGKPDIPNSIMTAARLYPLDKSFSIHKFENAIQSVVSSGSLGHNFISSVLRVGETTIKQQESFTSTPDGMYS